MTNEILTVPVVSKNRLNRFLRAAQSYIEDNPVIIDDDKVTIQNLRDTPSLFTNCQAKAKGFCPDQGNHAKNCHLCPHAEATLKNVTEIAPGFGFEANKIQRYSGMGIMDLSFDRGWNSHVNIEINGDKGGIFFATTYPHRRPTRPPQSA